MDWIEKFDLFLFDFDGLLVNTEKMHYEAYKNMLAHHGVLFDWDFNRYCQAAHYEAEALKNQITVKYPSLLAAHPWETLYREKQAEIQKLIHEGHAHLMPGVTPLLEALQAAGIPRVVVTHSPDSLIRIVREQNPILNTIPHWVTREHYSRPKPDPECYHYALQRYASPTDRIIGFEDTPRGLTALFQTRALPVLICTVSYPEIPTFVDQGAKHFPSFEAIDL